MERNCGPDTAAFFDNGKVAKLRITVNAEALQAANKTADQWGDLLWDKWNNHCGPYDWVPVRMEYESPDGIGNVAMDNVGMRMRGTKSRGTNPLGGFKLDFNNQLPEGEQRRFADLGRMELLSNESDPSEMIQCMTYKLVRDAGVVAPRCNHLQVYVNGKLYGLMQSVERAKDGRYLKHRFGDSNGMLYAASSTCGWDDFRGDLAYYGDKSTDYVQRYEVLVGTPADAEVNLFPLLKCGDQKTTPDDEAFRTCIGEWIDVHEWLSLIAAESVIPTVEDFVGAKRNFFLYFQPDPAAPRQGKMRIWGWDYDTALQRQACTPSTCNPFTAVPGYDPLGKRAPFVQRLQKVFKAEYCQHLKTFVQDVFKPEKVDEMANVIAPFMAADPVYTQQQWLEGTFDPINGSPKNNGVNGMRAHFLKRATAVTTMIETACKDVGLPVNPDAGTDAKVSDATSETTLDTGASDATAPDATTDSSAPDGTL